MEDACKSQPPNSFTFRPAEDSNGQSSEPSLMQEHAANQSNASPSKPLTVRTHATCSSASRMNSPSPTHGDGVCWGWLEPTPESRALPHVMLRGGVVGIGRGADAFDLVLRQITSPSLAGGSPRGQASTQPTGVHGVLAEGGISPQVPGIFVEIADGRVSRVHCLISAGSNSVTNGVAITSSSSSSGAVAKPAATLRDVSSNGTFLNGKKLCRGEEAPLSDGDRISLVISVAPLAEQAFLFHAGHPLTALLEGPPPAQWIGWKGRSLSRAATLARAESGRESPPLLMPVRSPGSPGSSTGGSPKTPLRRVASYGTALRRSATSLYTTPEAAMEEPSTLQCQICLDTFVKAVALEPCGHSFCAACLSQHLAACLGHGQALACPLRCAAPQRVVINHAIRHLLATLHANQAATAAAATASTSRHDGGGFPSLASGHLDSTPEDEVTPPEESYESNIREISTLENTDQASSNGDSNNLDNEDTRNSSSTSYEDPEVPGSEESSDGMHPSVPLEDSNLPLALHTLKDDQLAFTLNSLALFSSLSEAEYAAVNPGTVAAGLELVARLTWSDEVARGVIGGRGGVETVVDCMRSWIHSETVLCSGCLAIMALVRGDGPGSSANRWQLGVCGGLEMLLEVMQRHKDQSMVQLSALLCLVPLALEGPFFQQEISRQGSQVILQAARRHSDCDEVVAKALLAAGALAQGGGPEADAAADLLVAGGVVEIVVQVLRRYRGGSQDEVLWAALFVLAVLARDNEDGVERSGYIERMVYMARAGVLAPLMKAAAEYKRSGVATGVGEDETILMAAEYLQEALARATALLWLRRMRFVSNAVCMGMSVVLAYKCYRKIKGIRARLK